MLEIKHGQILFLRARVMASQLIDLNGKKWVLFIADLEGV
jgi:hypothetical protein